MQDMMYGVFNIKDRIIASLKMNVAANVHSMSHYYI